MSDPVARLNAALAGRYAIERELGEGGMATVYLADDIKHERKVALKVLKPELAAVVGAERFLAEIKTTANLTHPHILPLHDSGEADGFLFYVMPHIEGESLRERIDREKQLGVDDSVAITQKVAGALDYAHENGVVHRDIKPGNILLSGQGEPLVADFGIALAVAQAGGGRITETGLSVGTPQYMSPEQAAGDRGVGPPTDIYALGCVLYELLVGEPPYTGASAQAILAKILVGSAKSVVAQRPSVPPHVDAAIAKALEKLPADRFRGAQEFATALTDSRFRHGDEAPVGVGAAASRPWKRLTGGFAALAAVSVLVAAWGWLRPAPQLQVTRSSMDLGDLSLTAYGEILVSPDGSRFALAGVSGSRPLYWRNADAEDFQPIPGTEGATPWASFSPDGQSLVFGAENSVRRVALSGGTPQNVATLPQGRLGGVHWGNDGNIFFTLGGGEGLYTVPATGGTPVALLEPSTPVRYPTLLPGGRAVMFTDPISRSTHVLDLETDSLRLLRSDAVHAMYVEAGHLLYVDQSRTLWAVAFDLSEAEIVGEPVAMFDGLTNTRGFSPRYGVSQNGTLVYGSIGSGEAEPYRLLVVDLDGNEEALPLTPRSFSEVKWSPDGQSVVYWSPAQGDQRSDIYTYDVESKTTPTQITFEGENRHPVFSPDGTRVAFASIREGTDGLDLWVKTLNDDQPARSIISLPGDQYPTHWPSDTLIVFESGTNLTDLWMLDLSDPDNLSPGAYLESEAHLQDMVLSPDGTLAVYWSEEFGSRQVYIRSFPEAGAPTRVSQGDGQRPFWAPDGNIVYYWGTRGGDHFIAARIQRDPTPVVLSQDTLFTTDYVQMFTDLHPDALSANVRETRSAQRIRVGRRQRKRTCWDCEREWKRMVVPLEPGRPSEARQLLRTRR